MSMPGQEDSAWTTNEMGVLNLGDKRLDKRMVRVLKQLSEKPGPGIPTACKGWAETLAAYRLFDNDKVTMEKVLAAHEKATAGRISQHPVVLCIEDTTELDYTDKKETVGLGQLSFKARQGLLLHPMLAVTPERIPLGCLRSFLWARDPEIHEKKKDRKRQAIEKKESVRWIEGYRFITELAPQLPETRLVYVADRESDVYELFVAAGQAADLLVRAAQNRRLADGGNLWEQMERSSALGTVSFDLPRRGKRPGRLVVQTLRAARIKLKAPRRRGTTLPDVEVTAILAKEKEPPAGAVPVEWMLLSNRSVTTFDEATEMMRWYLCRWQIEIFFHVLKNGCKIEKLQLAHVDRLRPAIALYMIIAWRVLYMTMLGRICPDLSCDMVFETEEWQAAYIVTKRSNPPEQPPCLAEIVKMVATFGGYLNRNGDGEPGPKALWIGLQRVRDFALGIKFQKELQQRDTCV